MNTKTYIKQLKQHLAALDSTKSSEIIKEIESYIQESNASYETLVEKFGEPNELASSYLEDMPLSTPKNNSFWKSTKKVMTIVASTILAIILITSYIVYEVTKDSFDYSKYDATTITSKVNDLWIDLEGITEIRTEQAEVVFYWGENEKLKYNCKGMEYSQTGAVLTIKQAHCFIILPKQTSKITSFQTDIMLIAPKHNVDLDFRQSSLRIAEMGNNYNYNISAKQSKVENFSSKQSDITINATVYQSKVKHYKY